MTDFNMWMMADNCELIIKSPAGELYHATFEYAEISSRFALKHNVIIPFYYHPTKFDEEGNPIGRDMENPIKAVLKIEQYKDPQINIRIDEEDPEWKDV